MSELTCPTRLFHQDMGYSLFDVWYMGTIGIRSGHTSFPPALTTFSGKAFVLREWVDVCKLIYTRLEQYYKQANINLNPYWNRLLNKRRRSCLLPSINILSGKQSLLQPRVRHSRKSKSGKFCQQFQFISWPTIMQQIMSFPSEDLQQTKTLIEKKKEKTKSRKKVALY